MSFVKSPLNYTGGKYKLLDQLMPMFPNPKEINTFVDLFTGGANVAANYHASKIIVLDKQLQTIELFDYFKNEDIETIKKHILEIIEYYDLSNSKNHSYGHYNANSSDGLGAYNKEKYNIMKKDYNDGKYLFNKNIIFFMLIVFGFNNQIRFNSKGGFNISVGKRDFNDKTEMNLENFVRNIQSQNISFVNDDFRNIDKYLDIGKDDFVYADPPYLITLASYNEQGGWTEKDEYDLLDYLDILNHKKVKFALSNLLVQGDKENKILSNWMAKYHVKDLSKNYKNSSYHKNKSSVKKEQEVLVTNFKN